MRKSIVLVLLFVSSALMAQKMKVVSGTFTNLKGINEFNLVFDYTGLKVDTFNTEEEFLAEKMEKRKAKGIDEEFRKSWFSDRTEKYEPKFIESFNKRFEGGVKIDKNLTDAKYTIVVKTLWIRPGFNIGIDSSPARINTLITIADNANASSPLLVVFYERAEGSGTMGFDYNSGYRISEAYAKLAKEFASDLKRLSKK